MTRIVFVIGIALAVAGCGDEASGGGGTDGSAVVGDMQQGDGAVAVAVDMAMQPADGGIPIHDGSVLCFVRTCQGKTYQCGDCIDNDNDGRVDDEDPDCLGACQNNEAGYFGKIPGQNNAPCKADCYFDQDTGGGILCVSQFTLYGDCRKGRRPSFDRAATPGVAEPLYESFLAALRAFGVHVETGQFQAKMEVELVNDGPVTLLLDSEKAL